MEDGESLYCLARRLYRASLGEFASGRALLASSVMRMGGGRGEGARRPGGDTGRQHLVLVGPMARGRRVVPLRGPLLNPVTLCGVSSGACGEGRAGRPGRAADASQ